jgi:hypothetical protein
MAVVESCRLLMTSIYLIEERIETLRETESGRVYCRDSERGYTGESRDSGYLQTRLLDWCTRVQGLRGDLLLSQIKRARNNDARTSEMDPS